MSRSPDYDIEAADLVARTLRAVAADTKVAGHPTLPSDLVPDLPASVTHPGGRRRRVRTTVAVMAAAATVVAGVLVWSNRDMPGAERPPDLGTTPSAENPSAPPELVPGRLPDGLVAVDDAASTQPSVMYATQAMVLERDGGHVLSAVITWPDGGPAVTAEVDLVAQAVGRLAGVDSGRARIEAPPGEVSGYLTMPLDEAVPDEDVRALHELLTSEGLSRVQDFARTSPGWTVRDADLGWVPGVAPTTVRSYTDGGGRRLDLYAVAGDLPTAGVVTALLPDAHPYPVGGLMGWRVSTCDPTGCANGPEEVTVWQAAPGTVGAIVADQVTDADVPATIDSLPAPEPTPGEHPNVRRGSRSEPGDVPWLVELADFVPGLGAGPCVDLWVAGQATGATCGLEVPAPGAEPPFFLFGPVAHLDGDATVVFGLVAPAVTRVTIDPVYGVSLSVETQPLDPADPDGLRSAVMIVHGGRNVPQIFRFRGARNVELFSSEIDLNVVGG